MNYGELVHISMIVRKKMEIDVFMPDFASYYVGATGLSSRTNAICLVYAVNLYYH